MDEVVVSFCIASYRRCEILKELILEILSVDSDQFDVIVCDNCSSDGTVEEIRRIEDERLKVYTNRENIGAPLNVCRSLDCGDGEYLFYVNDRDNVNPFKVKKLIHILEEMRGKNVGFAQCNSTANMPEDYRIFAAGREALFEFACRIVHPTGYIFRRDVWRRVSGRRAFFEKECYGDYGLTLVSAIASREYAGVQIYGDICDVRRRRIDFEKEKSRYYEKKKDQRTWYFPEVQWRELMVAYRFLKKLGVEDQDADELLRLRYREYLYRLVILYRGILSDPCNTAHYNLKVPRSSLVIGMKSVKNGLFLWRRMAAFCRDHNKEQLRAWVDADTKLIYAEYFF